MKNSCVLGQISCKIREFCYFSGNYDVKFGHFVNFSCISIFGQKCFAPKVDSSNTPAWVRSGIAGMAHFSCAMTMKFETISEFYSSNSTFYVGIMNNLLKKLSL